MDPLELSSFPEYNIDIDRNKIRFNGIGPRVLESPTKIWPRDILNPHDEFRKIISVDIEYLSQQQYERSKQVIIPSFEYLRKINIGSLFDKCCPYDRSRKGLRIPTALDQYTSYEQVISFINLSLRSINSLRSLFGGNHNYVVFKRNIKWLVSGNRLLRKIEVRHILFTIDNTMNLNDVTWLAGLHQRLKYRLFSRLILALIRYILELLRRYFYITVTNPYCDKIFYYRYDLWQKIQHRKIEQMIRQQVLVQIAITEDLRLPCTAISRMKFYPKHNDLRLICTKPRGKIGDNIITQQLKAILNYVLDKYPNYNRFTLNNLLCSLRRIKEGIIGANMQFYVVRTDIKDCFQSVDQELMRTIIKKSLTGHMKGDTLKLFELSCLVKSRRKHQAGKRIIQWTLDPDHANGLGKFLDTVLLSTKYLSIENEFDQVYLRPVLINPVLRESRASKVGYILQKGLEQGSSFSPILCAIYIQEAFNEYLKDFLTDDDCELFCYVDDILFISTDVDKASKFMDKMLLGFKKFNLKMNLNKMKCNFPCKGLEEKLCQFESNYVIFYRHQISLSTLECAYNYGYAPIEIQDTFRLSPYFCEVDITYSIAKIRVNSILLDCYLNGIDTVISNIFRRLLFFAHRAAALILVSFSFRNHQTRQNPKFIISLMKSSAKRVFLAMRQGIINNRIENSFSYHQVRLLAASAFEKTWSMNKMMHRKLERETLRRFKRRYELKHLISQQSDDLGSDWWKQKLSELEDGFLLSHFHKDIILPSKRTTRRDRYQ